MSRRRALLADALVADAEAAREVHVGEPSVRLTGRPARPCRP